MVFRSICFSLRLRALLPLMGLPQLTACVGELRAPTQREQLKQALPTGLALPMAKQALQANGVTFSEKTAVECETRQSRGL